MSQDKLRKVHFIYGIVLSCLIILTGICFIVSCVLIYASGGRPFTRDSISEHFGNIAIPVILSIVGILGGIVLSFFPLEIKPVKPCVSNETVLNAMQKRCNASRCYGPLGDKARIERALRKITGTVCIILNVLSVVLALIYGLNKNNFPATSINSEMVDMALFMLPCVVIGLGAIYATVLICTSSISRELDITKQIISKGKGEKHYKSSSAKLYLQSASNTNRVARIVCKPMVNDSTELKPRKKSIKNDNSTREKGEKLLLGVRLSIIVIAVTFIIIGIFNGGMADVLQKAINICTECIGLG